MENVATGFVCALTVVPIGIIAFVASWGTLFIAPLIFLGIAWLAVILYRLGAGGPVSWRGTLCIIAVMIVTLALSVFTGLITEVAFDISSIARLSPLEALGVPQYWTVFSEVLNDPAAQSRIIPSILAAATFAAIGIFSALRGVFHRQSLRVAKG